MIKIGLIGVGAMGSRIATRLIDHGYELRLHNRSASKLYVFKKGQRIIWTILNNSINTELNTLLD